MTPVAYPEVFRVLFFIGQAAAFANDALSGEVVSRLVVELVVKLDVSHGCGTIQLMMLFLCCRTSAVRSRARLMVSRTVVDAKPLPTIATHCAGGRYWRE